MSSSINKQAVPAGLYLKFITARQGIAGVLSQGATLVVGGQSFTIPDLLVKVDAEIGVYQGIRDLRTLLHQKVADKRLREPSQRRFLNDLEAAVKGQLGVDNADLVKFGYKPKKTPRTLTPAERVAKQEKATATRAKHHPKPETAGGGASSALTSPAAPKP
jgi:hypothetical protein